MYLLYPRQGPKGTSRYAAEEHMPVAGPGKVLHLL